MAYTPIVNVNISINATPLTRVGFGVPLFITAHRFSEDRVIEISSAAELTAAPYNFPTTHPAYIAAGKVFEQVPKVPTMKIGRRDMNGVVTVINPTDDATTNYSFNITAMLSGTSFTTTIAASVTDVAGNMDEEDVVDALVTAFGAVTELSGQVTAQRVGSGTSSTLLISSVEAGDDAVYFTLEDQVSGNSTTSYTAYETPADTFNAIAQVDVDWYFVAVEERDNDTYVLACQDALGGLGKAHLFFYASANTANLSAYQAGNQDLFARLRDENADTVVTFFHHQADEYVELSYIAANATAPAGSVTWANIQIRNVGFSQDPSRNRPLTTAQKSNLLNKNANFIELDSGVGFTRTGKTAGGEWIDVIRGVDWQTSDLNIALRSLLLNQKGGKINYTDQGVAQIREVISSSLQRGVNRQFLTNYEVNVPLVSSIATNDRISRILTGVTFTGYLAGAIHEVTLNGVVTV